MTPLGWYLLGAASLFVTEVALAFLVAWVLFVWAIRVTARGDEAARPALTPEQIAASARVVAAMESTRERLAKSAAPIKSACSCGQQTPGDGWVHTYRGCCKPHGTDGRPAQWRAPSGWTITTGGSDRVDFNDKPKES